MEVESHIAEEEDNASEHSSRMQSMSEFLTKKIDDPGFKSFNSKALPVRRPSKQTNCQTLKFY